METGLTDIHQYLRKAWNDFVSGGTVAEDAVDPKS
jgi:hypothetical protein